MAIAKPKSPHSRRQGMPWKLLVLAIVLGAIGWIYRTPILGYAAAGSSYSAHVACSCHYIGGRSLEDCKKDRLAGMEFVSLNDDAQTKSITARYPLMPPQTATYRKGYGCVMQKWDD